MTKVGNAMSRSETTPGKRGEATRQLILDSAENCFAQYGLQGTRIRDIADAAGVNVATLYIYYKNKQALYEAVLNQGIHPVAEIIRSYAAEDFSEEARYNIIEAITQHLHQRPGVSKLIYLESINDGAHLQQLSQRWFQPLAQTLMKNLSINFDDEALKQQLVGLFFNLSFGHFALSPLLDHVFTPSDITPATSSPEGIKQHAHFIHSVLTPVLAGLKNNT